MQRIFRFSSKLEPMLQAGLHSKPINPLDSCTVTAQSNRDHGELLFSREEVLAFQLRGAIQQDFDLLD